MVSRGVTARSALQGRLPNPETNDECFRVHGICIILNMITWRIGDAIEDAFTSVSAENNTWLLETLILELEGATKPLGRKMTRRDEAALEDFESLL